MILAAGFGTRLQEFTRDLPKPLVKIRGHYLIEYPLYALKRAGITDIIINVHHLGHKIRDILQDGRSYGLNISFSHEETILGTGGGVKNAEFFFSDESFLLINSDIICDIDLASVMNAHLKKHAHATMVVREDRSLPNFNKICLNDDHRVLAVNQVPRALQNKAVTERMFTGIHVLSPIVFSYLKPEFSSIISDFYQKGIADGLNIVGFDFNGFWLDAGTIKNIEFARTCPNLPKIEF